MSARGSFQPRVKRSLHMRAHTPGAPRARDLSLLHRGDRIVRLPIASSNKSFVLVSDKKKYIIADCFLTSRLRIANRTAILLRSTAKFLTDSVPEFVRSLARSNLIRSRSPGAPFEFGAEMELAKGGSSDDTAVLQRAILIPSYDWDSSRVSGGHPIRIHVLRRSSERAKLFDQWERKISGILPEAVNLARQPILLTLIGPTTETEE